MPEVKTRCGSMKGVLKTLRKNINNKKIPLKRKASIVKGHLFSKGLFQANTWRRLNVQECQQVHSNVMNVYRALLGQDKPRLEHRMTDTDILRELEALTPLAMIARSRLALFQRLMVKPAPSLLLVLAESYECESSWIRTVHEDLCSIAQFTNKLEEYRQAPLMDWVQLIRQHPKYFCKFLNQVFAAPEVNSITFWWPAESRSTEAAQHIDEHVGGMRMHACELCDYVGKSINAIVWHKYDKHGIKHDLRQCIVGETCCACLQLFHTRERLVRHIINSSPKCKSFYRDITENAPPEIIELEEEEASRNSAQLKREGFRSTKSKLPPIRAFGPLHPIAELKGISHNGLLKGGFIKKHRRPRPLH